MLKKLYIAVLVCICIPAGAESYRWTDDTGQTHYSYTVPASKSYLGHVEMSKQGIATKKVYSEKRKKQLKEIAELRKIRNKQTAKDIKEREAQEAEDNLLLSVFSSEDELKKAYNSKLELAQVTINLLKSRHKKQSSRLEILEQKHERMAIIKHKQALEKQIDVVLDNLKIYQQAITENLIEKNKVRGEYKTTLNRFRKLMAKSLTK